MREIKYRQWMGDHFNYWGFNVPEGAVFSGPSSQGGKPSSDYPQDQFTGTKDINGTEIYDQDIVEAKGNLDPELVSQHRGMWIVGDGLTPSILWKWRAHDIEVIGNIWENPELLK